MKLAIGNDHTAVDLKNTILAHLEDRGVEVINVGTDSTDSFDYPLSGYRVGKLVASGEVDGGVLICGTGIGMAIAANKVHGIRAANVITPEFAALAREHNDANVVTVSGRFVSDEVNREIVKTFLNTEFGGGRHAGRVDKIMALDGDTLPEPPELI